jgi:hypothetical protein
MICEDSTQQRSNYTGNAKHTGQRGDVDCTLPQWSDESDDSHASREESSGPNTSNCSSHDKHRRASGCGTDD